MLKHHAQTGFGIKSVLAWAALGGASVRTCYCACTRMLAGIIASDKKIHRLAINHAAPRI